MSRFFTSIRTCASAARARARRASANRIGMAVAGHPTFCAPVDRRNLLSVLGIVTTQQTNYRQAIRDSWMRHGEASSVTKLVMRGLGASEQLLREAAAYRDIVFLPERERQHKASGPLISTLLWLSCAVVAWPNAALVGKSEDDVWLHLPDVYDSLRGSMAALRARGVDHLYWGLMEYYHFNESSGRPIGFGQVWGGKTQREVWQTRCRRKPWTGQFAFAKGALYFLSRAVAQRLVDEPRAKAAASRALGTAGTTLSAIAGGPSYKALWEDVWLGMALSNHLEPPPNLGIVSLTFAFVSESWGVKVSPAMFLWHAKTKDERRTGFVETWARKHHCSRGVHVRPSPTCERRGITCSGGNWMYCTEGSLGRCSGSKTVDLAGTIVAMHRSNYTRTFEELI